MDVFVRLFKKQKLLFLLKILKYNIQIHYYINCYPYTIVETWCGSTCHFAFGHISPATFSTVVTLGHGPPKPCAAPNVWQPSSRSANLSTGATSQKPWRGNIGVAWCCLKCQKKLLVISSNYRILYDTMHYTSRVFNVLEVCFPMSSPCFPICFTCCSE